MLRFILKEALTITALSLFIFCIWVWVDFIIKQNIIYGW